MRLIDANALWAEFMELAGTSIEYDAEGVANAIADAPSVDAVEVVHGRWVERRHDGMGGGWYALFHCSECDTPSAKTRNYCSFCGADMREPKEASDG